MAESARRPTLPGGKALKEELSASEAPRIALMARGFNAMIRSADIGAAALTNAIRRLGLLQIDSVNVLVRAHYLPLFSRLGAYDRAALDALAAERRKRFFEYWGRVASLLPVDLHPLLRWRMARAEPGEGAWGGLKPFAGGRRAEADALLARIRSEGPLAASDVGPGTVCGLAQAHERGGGHPGRSAGRARRRRPPSTPQ